MTVRHAQRVFRLFKPTDYFGCQQTTIDEMVRIGLLRPVSMTPGGRSKVVTEANIIEVQEAALETGNIEALIARAKRERGGPSSNG
jgi:hypothetical protein